MVLNGFGMVWKGLGGFGRVWEGWGGVGRVPSPLQPPKPRQIVRCLRMLTHARSYLNPLSGIPEGSIDSIGDPLGQHFHMIFNDFYILFRPINCKT